MKRNIFIGLAAVFFIIISFFAYISLTTRSHSPLDTVEYTYSQMDLKVTYCQPYKKGRLVFGEKDAGAVVPFGYYWRLGANDATEITFGKDVLFANQPIPAGSYRMYAVAYKDRWEISLNSELGQFGYFTPNYELDIVKVNVPVQSSTELFEQLTVRFTERDDTLFLTLNWDETLVEVPISIQE